MSEGGEVLSYFFKNIKLSPWVEIKEGSALLGACSPGVAGDWGDGTLRKNIAMWIKLIIIHSSGREKNT